MQEARRQNHLEALTQAVQTLGSGLAGAAGQGLGALVNLDAGNDAYTAVCECETTRM